MTDHENNTDKDKSKNAQNKDRMTDPCFLITLITNAFNESFINISQICPTWFPTQNVSPLQSVGDPIVN